MAGRSNASFVLCELIINPGANDIKAASSFISQYMYTNKIEYNSCVRPVNEQRSKCVMLTCITLWIGVHI